MTSEFIKNQNANIIKSEINKLNVTCNKLKYYPQQNVKVLFIMAKNKQYLKIWIKQNPFIIMSNQAPLQPHELP